MSDDRTHEDAFNLLCGEKIAVGSSRMVFECRIRLEWVVKVEIEKDWRTFENMREFQIWQIHASHSASQWLAPCKRISPDGRILLQERCDPLPRNYELPEKVPDFLNDLKPENFGLLNGRLVCLDYALAHLDTSMKMKGKKWHVPA